MQWHSDDWNSKRYPLPFHHPFPPTRLHLISSPVTRSTQVILACQGQSTLHAIERSQTELDEASLTEAGRMTARQTGAWLRGTPIDVIYASPLKRSQQTVKELLMGMEADWHHLNPIHLHWHLQEIDLLEGQEFSSPNNDAPDDDASGTEQTLPITDLYDRAHRFWQDILPRHVGQTLLLVNHRSTNQALINTALGFSACHHHKLQQSQGGISMLNFTDQTLSKVQLHTLNATHHLEAGLPKLRQGNQGLRLLLLPIPVTLTQQQQTRKLLQATTIDFSLSAEEVPQNLVAEVLTHHPKTVHLQVAREDFAQVWQRSIMQRKTDSNHLITGLVIAPIAMVQALLKQAIGGEQHSIPQLAIQAGHLSVIHYPALSHSPILQSVNLGFDHKTRT